MKKRKTLVVLLVIVLVLATMMSIFVACKPKPKPGPEPLLKEDVIAGICDSLRATYAESGMPFGWDAELEVMGYSIKSNGRLDKENKDNTKFVFDLSKGDEQIINLSADHTYMYAVQNDYKRRFNDFQLQQMIEGASFNSSQQNLDIINYIQIGLTAIFSREDDTFSVTKNGSNKIYELKGNLSEIVKAADSLLGADAEGIKEVLSILNGVDIIIKLEADSNKKVKNFTVDLESDIVDIKIGASKLLIGPDAGKNVQLPEGRDAFITTNALNFTVEGSVTLKQNKNFVKADVYSMDYTIRVDYNIFRAMRESIKTVDGKLTFDPKGLLSDPSNKIYIDLNHKCANNGNPCSYCKDNREDAGQGSFLTVAYAPQDFDNNNINVALDIKQLLPKGLLSQLVDLGGLDIVGMFESGKYIGIGIDPLAFMINGDNYKEFSATTNMEGKLLNQIAGIDFKSMLNPNILGILVDVFDFAKEIQLSDADGLTLGTKQLCKLISYLDTDEFAISDVFAGLFSGSDYCQITTDTAVYGDDTTQKLNLYEEFMIIDKSLSDYKQFGFNNSAYSPVKSIEWVLDKDNNVVITESTIQNYDKDGNALCLSEQEAKTLFTKGYAQYNYVTMHGKQDISNVGIHSVYGLDYSKKGVEQTVTVVTYMTDAGALSGLLDLVGGFVEGMDLRFPGNYFTTKVIITDIEGEVKFEQGDDVASKYDSEKVYVRTTDKINPYFTATITYKDEKSSTKSIKVAPENMSDYFANFGTPDNAYLKAVNDFDAVYNVFGQKITKRVKVEKHVDKVIKKTVKVDETLATGTTFYAYLGAESGKRVSVYATKNKPEMKMTINEGNADGITFTSEGANGAQEKGTFKFVKAGNYKVSLYVTSGFTQTYEFEVTSGKPIGKIPGYAIDSATFAGKEINITTARTDNYGEGLKVNFAVIGMKDGETLMLVNGVDYDLYEVIGGARTKIEQDAFLKKSYVVSNQTFVIVLKDTAVEFANKTTKVIMMAKDFENAVIGEVNISNAFEAYVLTTGAIKKDSGGAIGFSYSALCPTNKVVKGLEIKVELKVKIDGATEWSLLSDDDYFNASKFEFWGSITYTPIELDDGTPVDIAFTNDGKSLGNDANIVFRNITSENVIYEFNIYAVNYDNLLIASATNAK